MVHLETVANPAIVVVTMLSACVLGIGFMVRFFVALTREDRNMHPVRVVHTQGVPCDADIACVAAPSLRPTGNSAYLAIGVVRITTALASNAGRRKSDAQLTGFRW
jgi:hypothetical protein